MLTRDHDGVHLEIRVLTSLAEIEAHAYAWRELERRCATELTYFQTYSWCRAWVAEFASSGQTQPRIRTAWTDGQLVAIWPLMLTANRFGVQKLESLGGPHSQYSNVICDGRFDSHAVTKQMVEELARSPDCDLAVLTAVPGKSRLAQALSARRSWAPAADESSMLDLTQYTSSEHYQASLGKLQRRSRNRRRNALAKLGALQFEMLWPDDPRYRDYLALCMAMKRQWLRETSRYSAGFALSGYEQFLATLEGSEPDLGGACLSVLSIDGRPVALELGFIRNRHYYSYIGAYDWDLRQHSPGKVQMAMTVCWLIDNGVAAYDLLGNAAEYKNSWTNRTEPLAAHTLAFSWRGRLYAGAWIHGLRPAGKRLFNAIPDTLRRIAIGNPTLGFLLVWV